MTEPRSRVALDIPQPAAGAEGAGGMPMQADAADIQRSLVQWLVLRHSGEWGAEHEQAFVDWLGELPQRQQAWQRMAQRLGGLRAVPPSLARTVLGRSSVQAVSRRRALGQLAWLPAIPLLSWFAWSHTPWRTWSAAYRTHTGEQRQIELADGSRLLLNTATAVDVRFTAAQRLLILHAGELQVTTAAALGREPGDAASMPALVVQTPCGTARALGTRFTVRHGPWGAGLAWAAQTRVDVFEGRVAVTANSDSAEVHAGQQIHFTAEALGPVVAMDEVVAGAWTAGMLVAQRMPLADFAAELDRYRAGGLRASSDVAQWQISGVFPVLEPDRCLYLLTQTLPVRLNNVTALWTSIVPA